MYEWGLQERFNVRALCPKLMQCHGGRLWALELQGGGGGGGVVLYAAYRERKGCCSKILGSSLAYKCQNWLHIWKLNQPRCRIKPLSCLLLPSCFVSFVAMVAAAVNNDEFLFDSQVFFENLDMLIRPPFLVIMSLSQISQCLTSFFSLATTSFVFRLSSAAASQGNQTRKRPSRFDLDIRIRPHPAYGTKIGLKWILIASFSSISGSSLLFLKKEFDQQK